MFTKIKKFFLSIPRRLGVDRFRLGFGSWITIYVDAFGKKNALTYEYLCAKILYDGIAQHIAINPTVFEDACSRYSNHFSSANIGKYPFGTLLQRTFKYKANNSTRYEKTWVVVLQVIGNERLTGLAFTNTQLSKIVTTGTKINSDEKLEPSWWQRIKLKFIHE